MRNTIAKYDPSFPIVQPDNGLMTQAFQRTMAQVQERGLLIGTGSPETVVEAQQGIMYMDETGAVGAVLYIKQVADISGDRSTGWIAIG